MLPANAACESLLKRSWGHTGGRDSIVEENGLSSERVVDRIGRNKRVAVHLLFYSCSMQNLCDQMCGVFPTLAISPKSLTR